MAEIRQIDYIVHPYWNSHGLLVMSNESRRLSREWHNRIEETAKDQTKAMVIVVWDNDFRPKKLLRYARERLGNRAIFYWDRKNGKFTVGKSRELFWELKEALQHHNLSYDPKKIVTRAMGENTLQCVFDIATELNSALGMKNPVPFRNRQSRILPKLSQESEYPTFAERKALTKESLRAKMRAYNGAHMEKAEYPLAERGISHKLRRRLR